MTTNEELRELAGRATVGEWVATPSMKYKPLILAGSGTAEEVRVAKAALVSDGLFIAAANPARVLALLDEVETLRAQVERPWAE